jgi:myo-inositol 2-dehydrogenase/D-chiro-inositol 1-dehydrogenase
MGQIGRIHAANVLRSPKLSLVAVASRTRSSADRAAAELGGGVSAVGVDEALSDPAVKAVIIANQTTGHVDYATRALERGKHVFLEKPGATSLAEHCRLRECAAQTDRVVATGYVRRYDEAFRKLKTQVDSGAIGAPHLINLAAREYVVPPSDLRAAAGFIADVGVHDFDTAAWIFGQEPLEVFATAQRARHPALTFDSVVVVVRFDGGAVATVHLSCNSRAGHDIRCEVVGADGSIALAGLAEGYRSLDVLDERSASGAPEDYSRRFDLALAAELDAFADRCRGRQDGGPDLVSDARALAVAVAARASVAERRPLQVGPDWPWYGPM